MKQFSSFFLSGSTDPSPSDLERENRALARRAAAEGMVLLKNDGLLPLSVDTPLALLGSGAVCTVKGGTGSGDVNERDSVNIEQGLRAAGWPIVSGDWLADYADRYQTARQTWRDRILGDGSEEALLHFFDTYSAIPFFMPDGRPVAACDLKDAKAAVYVISRTAGENADRRLVPGDYYLTGQENADLHFLNEQGLPTVLVINAGSCVEITEVVELPCVKAVFYIAQPGQEGGNAFADVLSGAVTPSGKLGATWAKHFSDYPNAASYSSLSGDTSKEYYVEDIYVGYRYFDRYNVRPLYGFGYGLSYTSFAIAVTKINGLSLTATVTNTGNRPGKEVVQVYLSCPQGSTQSCRSQSGSHEIPAEQSGCATRGLCKERRRLAAFAKTPLLAPGETTIVNMSIPPKQLASFDEAVSAWIADAGDYGLWVGNSLESSTLIAVLKLENEAVIERVQHICPLRQPLETIPLPLISEENYEGLPIYLIEPKLLCEERSAVSASSAPSPSPEAVALAASVPARELIPLLMGEIRRTPDTAGDVRTPGAVGDAGTQVPGSAGETSSALAQKLGLSSLVMADGPAGLRLTQCYEADPESGEIFDPGPLASLERGFFAKPEHHSGAVKYYQYCTAFPVGTLLAQSFDTALLEEVGRAVAKEMACFHVSWWLAPGMNIQRNPLCGRNFEYYSEDPFLSGKLAAAITRGVQQLPGVGTTIKHMACNNQEDNRTGSDSILTERALREIYLRGFEIAVKESQPLCIMTSYNLVNGVHAANNYDLCTVAARQEWGFGGVIMSDWTTTLPESGSLPYLCVKAGNDLIMPGMESDLKNIVEAYEDGRLADEDIRRCAARLIENIFKFRFFGWQKQ